jgi:lipopolysaccharide export system permease protein
MKGLHKYWLKEFCKFFFITQLIILVLFLFIEYLTMMDKFLNSDISLPGALWFVLLEIPFIGLQVTPASILLANIFVFGSMNRNNELLALKSSGISMYELLKPSIFSSMLVMTAMIFAGECIVPFSMIQAQNIEYGIIRQGDNVSIEKNNMWIRSGKKLIRFEHFDPATQIGSGITILFMGENFHPESRIDAKKGKYREGTWICERIIQQDYNHQSKKYDITSHAERKIMLEVTPEDICRTAKKTEAMTFFELKHYAEKVKSEGYDATRYIVDLHNKIALPFVCIVMAMAGAVTGMHRVTRKSIQHAVTTGIVISFMYWFFHGISLSLGYGGILTAVMAAWLTNLFFLGCGIVYFFQGRIEKT